MLLGIWSFKNRPNIEKIMLSFGHTGGKVNQARHDDISGAFMNELLIGTIFTKKIISFPPSIQCDQIGREFKVCGDQFSHKSDSNICSLFGLFWITYSFQEKNALGTFWATFEKFRRVFIITPRHTASILHFVLTCDLSIGVEWTITERASFAATAIAMQKIDFSIPRDV